MMFNFTVRIIASFYWLTTRLDRMDQNKNQDFEKVRVQVNYFVGQIKCLKFRQTHLKLRRLASLFIPMFL